MAQVSSYDVANRSGAQVRSDINDIFAVTKKFNKEIVAGVKKENVCGIQFHPEKSGQTGIRFLHELIRGFNE